MQIRKAKRSKSRIRLGLIGPSGSGKTLSALLIAYGIVGDWEKIGVIDTENRSADLYAGAEKGGVRIGEFLKIDLTPPYTPDKYVQAIKMLENAGVDVIIVDSLSHAWTGEGGFLDIHSQAAAKAGNSFAAWREVTPKHNRLVETMLSSSAHIIATMRAKAEYVIDQDDKGRKTVRKVGLAPIQRDGMEYEFDIVLDLSQDHSASVSKDRTGIFDGEYFVPSPDTGRRIVAWLKNEPAPAGPARDIPPPRMEPEHDPVPVDTSPETGGETSEQRGVFRILTVNRVVKGDQTFAIAKVVSEDGEELSVAARGEVMERVEAMKGSAAFVVLKKNDRGWWIVEEIDPIPVNDPVPVEEQLSGQDGPDGTYEVVEITRRKTPQGTPYAQITLMGAEGKIHALARDQAYADIELLGLEPGKKIRAEIEERNGFKVLTRVLEPVEV